jgi:hypothetical protein
MRNTSLSRSLLGFYLILSLRVNSASDNDTSTQHKVVYELHNIFRPVNRLKDFHDLLAFSQDFRKELYLRLLLSDEDFEL